MKPVKLFAGSVLNLFMAIIMSCSGKNLETQETHWPDGLIHERWTVVSNEEGILIRQGHYQSWYENGQIYEEGDFVDDMRDGNWTRWHGTDPNVKIMEGRYENGQMDGRWYYWMDPGHMNSGVSMSHADHQSGSHSESRDNHPASHKFAEFQLGKPNGISMSYHHSGQTADSFAYVDGKLDGDFISYYENGQASTFMTYTNGVRVGKQIFYDTNGVIIKEIE